MEQFESLHIGALDPFAFLERSAAIFREKMAVVEDTCEWTYPELLDRVNRLAAALQERGVRAGDRVAVLSPNAIMPLEATFAVPRLGAILCALNIRLAAPEIRFILDHCGAAILVYDAELDDLVAQLKLDIPALRVRGKVAGNSSHDDYEIALTNSSDTELVPYQSHETDTISINYTSGTTGRPKGVMYTYRGVYLNALSELFHANLRPESVYLWTLPLFHCNGWCFPWAVTGAGATHVMLRRSDAVSINDAIAKRRVTHMCAAPTVVVNLANAPETRPFSSPLAITVAGAPPSPTTIAQVEALGAELNHVYGLTETYGPITVCQWKAPQWESLPASERALLKSRQGHPMLTVQTHDVRVVDEHHNDVPADGITVGEVVMRGNNVMKGYYADAQATASAFRGGWFHSGDVAVVHQDGYLEITDRIKDIIISGGENISTQQVEKVLMGHDAVLEVAVVAIPDDKWGEVPKAFITLKPDRRLEAAELIEFARKELAPFKVPKQYEFGPLPKTSTGKIQKFLIRERDWIGRPRRVN